jgi:hypothetical protein
MLLISKKVASCKVKETCKETATSNIASFRVIHYVLGISCIKMLNHISPGQLAAWHFTHAWRSHVHFKTPGTSCHVSMWLHHMPMQHPACSPRRTRTLVSLLLGVPLILKFPKVPCTLKRNSDPASQTLLQVSLHLAMQLPTHTSPALGPWRQKSPKLKPLRGWFYNQKWQFPKGT